MTGNQGTSELDTASHFAKRVEANQRKLAASLKPTYDFVVCGAGSSGSVVARRQSCTAKMGRDAMSVVDAQLRVYGIDNLRIADASIMPRITTGNTMAPCVVIGERASDLLRTRHGL